MCFFLRLTAGRLHVHVVVVVVACLLFIGVLENPGMHWMTQNLVHVHVTLFLSLFHVSSLQREMHGHIYGSS